MEAGALFNQRGAFNGVKQSCFELLIFIRRAEIPKAAPITENGEDMGNGFFKNFIKETELLSLYEPVIVVFRHCSVLNEANKTFFVKINFAVEGIIKNTCAADCRHGKHSVINVAEMTVEVKIGCGYLTAVAETENVDLILAAVTLDILNKFVRNFIPEVSEISTDAVIGLNATCKGDYVHATGKLPVFSIDLLMPRRCIVCGRTLYIKEEEQYKASHFQ